jgi:hypothetical protein
MGFKSGPWIADVSSMGPHPVATIETGRPRRTRDAATRGASRYGVIAIVIECVDKTCTVVGSDFSLDFPSIHDAMGSIEEMTPPVVWREATPGYWVARAG